MVNQRYETARRPRYWPWFVGGAACAALALLVAWGIYEAQAAGWLF